MYSRIDESRGCLSKRMDKELNEDTRFLFPRKQLSTVSASYRDLASLQRVINRIKAWDSLTFILFSKLLLRPTLITGYTIRSLSLRFYRMQDLFKIPWIFRRNKIIMRIINCAKLLSQTLCSLDLATHRKTWKISVTSLRLQRKNERI